MAAMAGALDVTLEKLDSYRLGDGRPARADDIARAIRVAAVAAGLATAALVGMAAALRAVRGGL
jgi:cobalamin biosynthesis protein CobD/CbiB